MENQGNNTAEGPVNAGDLDYLKELAGDLGRSDDKEITTTLAELSKGTKNTPANPKAKTAENNSATNQEEEEDENEGEDEGNDEGEDEKGNNSKKEKVDANQGGKGGQGKKSKTEDKGEEEGEEDEDDDEDENVIDDKDDVFGTNQNKSKSKDLDVQLDEKALKVIEKNFGIKDAKTFFKSAQGWRNDSQQLKTTSKELGEIKDAFGKMPVKLASAVNAWARGEEWEEELSKVRIDFNKKFEDHDKVLIVSHYNKDAYEKLQKKLKDESITEEDFNERIDELHSSAKQLYALNKQAYDKQRADYLAKSDEDRKALKDSAVSSVDQLSAEFPHFKKNELQSIRQTLVNGELDSLFYDKDGRYVKDAAKMIAFAKYGERMFKAMLARKKTEGRNEATEEMINNADRNVKTKKSTEAAAKNEQDKAVDHLKFGLVNKSPFE